MGTQLQWENFVASKACTIGRWVGNYNGRILWHQRFETPTHLGMQFGQHFSLHCFSLQFKFKDFNADKVGNHQHNVLGTHKI
jgi:hypothetical protein